MDLLKNRELLRGLLQQGDMLNTVNGGVVEPRFSMQEDEFGIVIDIVAPTVSAEHFDIVLDNHRLSIAADINDPLLAADQQFKMPLFTKFFDLPSEVDLDVVEAVHDGHELKIILPFRNTDLDAFRKIDIKNL